MDYAIQIITVLTAVVIYVYYVIQNKKNYWKRKGISTVESTTFDFRTILRDAYYTFKDKGEKYGGLIILLRPIFLVVDLDILKSILIKDFDHFVNHSLKANEKLDPLSGILPALHDEKWRTLRTKLTPAFSSGKLKMMFSTMVECTNQLKPVIQRESKLGPIDIKDLLARFTTDIIGSVGFGIDCNSIAKPNSEFRVFGRRLNDPNWRKTAYKYLPKKLLHALAIKPKTKEVEGFFLNLTKEIIEYREKNNVYRKDFMHMMLQLKNRGKVVDDEKIVDDNNKGNEYMNFNELAAQCFVFFIGGFETSSSLMTFALLELAQHQDIQEKLRQEMKNVIKKHGGLTYDAIMEMEYLDQVVHEALRIHPPVFSTDRLCKKDYKIPGTDIILEKNTQVLVPIREIHYDPEHYPEPEKFIPERFSNENKAKRHPLTFLPFGEGPRMCIGARLGLVQSKVGLTAVLTNFKVELNKKTKIPIEYRLFSGIVGVKGDVWLDLIELNK